MRHSGTKICVEMLEVRSGGLWERVDCWWTEGSFTNGSFINAHSGLRLAMSVMLQMLSLVRLCTLMAAKRMQVPLLDLS